MTKLIIIVFEIKIVKFISSGNLPVCTFFFDGSRFGINKQWTGAVWNVLKKIV